MVVNALLRGLFRRKPKPPASAAPTAVKPRILNNDVFLVSYPKSGNTWLRFLIANYLSDDPVDFVNLHRVMPDLHLDPELASPTQSQPRFIKSHSAFDASFPRVVYLLRDPRDVAVSAFFHSRKFNLIDVHARFDEFIYSFIEVGFQHFGPWDEHVEGWLNAPRMPLLRVHYEAMLADPRAELRRILTFGGLEIDTVRVARAVERSSLWRMQELEDVQHDEYFRRWGSVTRGLRFVREGRAGSWRDYFGGPELARFLDRYGKTMHKYGYC